MIEAILDVHFEAFEETLGVGVDSDPDFDSFEKYLQLYKNFAPPSFNLKIQDLIEAGLEELAEHYSLTEYDEFYSLYNQHPSLKEAFLRAVKTDYDNSFGLENDADEFQILINSLRQHPNILKEIEKNRDVFFISDSETTAECGISIFFNRPIGDMSIFVEGIWAASLDELATKLEQEKNIHAERILELARNSLIAISKDGALAHKDLSHVKNPSKSKQWAARAIDNTGKVVPAFKGTMG